MNWTCTWVLNLLCKKISKTFRKSAYLWTPGLCRPRKWNCLCSSDYSTSPISNWNSICSSRGRVSKKSYIRQNSSNLSPDRSALASNNTGNISGNKGNGGRGRVQGVTQWSTKCSALSSDTAIDLTRQGRHKTITQLNACKYMDILQCLFWINFHTMWRRRKNKFHILELIKENYHELYIKKPSSIWSRPYYTC